MRRQKWLRMALGALLYGGTLFGASCGDLVRQSVKEGLTGGISSTFSSAQFSDFMFNMLSGGQTTN